MISWPVSLDEDRLRTLRAYRPDQNARWATAVDVHVTEGPADVAINVRDRGPGVPDALLPRLTDPFFRVDPSRDAHTGGVGLGLAIAQRALRLHRGTLVAENANPGLRVTLTIPHDKLAAEPAAHGEAGGGP